MEYEVLDLDEAPVTDLSEIEALPPDLDIKPVGDLLGLEKMRATVWYFEPGEEIQYHAHSEQEEPYSASPERPSFSENSPSMT